MPQDIESLEQAQARIRQALNDPALYQKDAAQAQDLFAEDQRLNDALLQAMARWETLSNKLEGTSA